MKAKHTGMIEENHDGVLLYSVILFHGELFDLSENFHANEDIVIGIQLFVTVDISDRKHGILAGNAVPRQTIRTDQRGIVGINRAVIVEIAQHRVRIIIADIAIAVFTVNVTFNIRSRTAGNAHVIMARAVRRPDLTVFVRRYANRSADIASVIAVIVINMLAHLTNVSAGVTSGIAVVIVDMITDRRPQAAFRTFMPMPGRAL